MRSGELSLEFCGLLVVDSHNLYCAGTDAYGRDSRIDYHNLRKTAEQVFPNIDIQCRAFLTFMDKDEAKRSNFDRFKLALNRKGWDTTELKQRGQGIATNRIQEVVESVSTQYNYFIFATGTGALLPLYKKLLGQGKEVAVLSFAEALSSEFSRSSVKVKLLDEAVLCRPRETRNTTGRGT